MSYMNDMIAENADKYGLVNEDQPAGVGVRYNNEAAPTKKVDGKHYGYATTSDKAHPTEAIYKLIANVWAQSIDYYPASSTLPNSRNKLPAVQELILGTLTNSAERLDSRLRSRETRWKLIRFNVWSLPIAVKKYTREDCYYLQVKTTRVSARDARLNQNGGVGRRLTSAIK
jgi:phospholipase/lecithinase/hemolysin